jgi:hypothetical protein
MATQSPVSREKHERIPMSLLFPLLWVFLAFNYIWCDHLSNMEIPVIRGLLEGNIAGIPVTQGFLLFSGISMEIPILMILLSAILPYKANRGVCCGAAILMLLFQLCSFFMGTPITLHYLFFSVIEILGNAAIAVLALRRKK